MRAIAAVAKFYHQPISEIRQLRLWEFNVLAGDMTKAAQRGQG